MRQSEKNYDWEMELPGSVLGGYLYRGRVRCLWDRLGAIFEFLGAVFDASWARLWVSGKILDYLGKVLWLSRLNFLTQFGDLRTSWGAILAQGSACRAQIRKKLNFLEFEFRLGHPSWNRKSTKIQFKNQRVFRRLLFVDFFN